MMGRYCSNEKQRMLPVACLLLALCLWGDSVQGFTLVHTRATPTRKNRILLRRSSHSHNGDDDDKNHPMASTSFLSHVMLRVPSVEKTAEYWKEKGGTIRIAKEKPGKSNGEAELMSAFLELGCHPPTIQHHDENNENDKSPVCFALELVATGKKNYSLGNVISYIGVSMLLQFKNNLLGAITGDKPISQGDEPNGILVKSAASAPGDYLSRFSLKSKDLSSTHNFYVNVLGMEAKGQDENMLCLRYDNDCFSAGIPTTLIFDATSTTAEEEEELEMGDCFDHLAIVTKTNIDEIYERTTQASEWTIFMKPTEMFGKKVMGVIDPNGYKVVIAS